MGPLEITSEWSLANARVCAEASDYAYTSGGATAPLQSELVKAVILDAGNARVIAFRGTASIRDWLTDLESWRTATAAKGGRTDIGEGEEVHHGFLDAIVSVTKALVDAVAWVKAPVFVTGHSLGGALALLAAQVLERAGLSPVSIYTFGGPRVGNWRWATDYDGAGARPPLGERTFRVVNEEDIVPRLPGWLMGYRHVGTEVFFPSIGSMWVNAPLWFKCVSDAIGTYRDWQRGAIAQLADHGIERYRARLGGEV